MKFDNVIDIQGVYTSNLWKNYYAAQFVVKQGGVKFRVRMPYKTEKEAHCALKSVMQTGWAPAPAYRPLIHMLDKNGRVL